MIGKKGNTNKITAYFALKYAARLCSSPFLFMTPALQYNSSQHWHREINDFAHIQGLLTCIGSNKQIRNYQKVKTTMSFKKQSQKLLQDCLTFLCSTEQHFSFLTDTTEVFPLHCIPWFAQHEWWELVLLASRSGPARKESNPALKKQWQIASSL